MISVGLVLSLVLFLTVGAQYRHVGRDALMEKFYKGNVRDLMSILSQPQMPQRYLTGNERFHSNIKKDVGVLKFSWSNCGTSSDLVQMKSLAISPDPIHVPGDLQVSFDVSSTVNITEPFTVDLTIKKKVAFWWVEIPCLNGQGSCNYDDFCTKLPASCPPSFIQNNIPCNCPFQQGDYKLTSGTVTVPELPLPSWATTGDYQANFVGTNPNGDQLFCYQISLSLD